LAARKVFENPCRSIDLREDRTVIWNEADVTFVDGPTDVFRSLATEISHGGLQTVLPDRVHHDVEERRAVAIDPKLRVRHGGAGSREGHDGQIEAISFDDRSVIHDHERSAPIRARGHRRTEGEDALV